MCMQALSMIMYDYDMLNADDEIGRCSIPISDLEDQKHYDMWLDVYDPAKEDETRAHIKVGPLCLCISCVSHQDLQGVPTHKIPIG